MTGIETPKPAPARQVVGFHAATSSHVGAVLLMLSALAWT